MLRYPLHEGDQIRVLVIGVCNENVRASSWPL